MVIFSIFLDILRWHHVERWSIRKTAAELSEELECHPKTIYRDLDVLHVAGFPVYTERVDGKNLWSLLDAVKHEIPILFNVTELMALYFSRDMLGVFRDTIFHDSLESLERELIGV